MAEPLPKGFGFSETAFRIFNLMASRRLKSDRFLSKDYRPEVYTKPGFDWVESTSMIDVLLRHFPKLKPAVSGIESAFHPCGTARIGRADDPTAVVDPECRVIGVERLRVADSSIFPRVTNGNLNAPSIMTGEKAADHILGRTPLAPSNQEPWINPRWQVSDR